MIAPSLVTAFPRQEITGVVLAGGRGRRMGGVDKGLVALWGQPMAAHALAALRPQVGRIVISANRHLNEYAALGCEVLSDANDDYLGPLAGVASALQNAKTRYVATVPCDSPLLAHDLVERLYYALEREAADISVAHDGERLHPVFALIQRHLLAGLRDYLDSGERKVESWFARHKYAVVNFRDRADSFINVNDTAGHAHIETWTRQARPN